MKAFCGSFLCGLILTAHGLCWTEPKTIASDIPLLTPRASINAHGSAVVIWGVYDENKYSVHAVTCENNVWSSPTLISPMGMPAAVDMDEQGRVIAIWSDQNTEITTITSSKYDPQNGWSAPIPVASGKSIHSPFLKVHPNGFSVIVWTNDETSSVEGVMGDISDKWDNKFQISEIKEGSYSPCIGIDDKKSVYLAYINKDKNTVYTQSLVEGKWSAPTPLAADAANLSININGDGTGTMSWTHTPTYQIVTSSLKNNTWISPEIISKRFSDSSTSFGNDKFKVAAWCDLNEGKIKARSEIQGAWEPQVRELADINTSLGPVGALHANKTAMIGIANWNKRSIQVAEISPNETQLKTLAESQVATDIVLSSSGSYSLLVWLSQQDGHHQLMASINN